MAHEVARVARRLEAAKESQELGFPNVIGVVDCTHVWIQKPSVHPEDFIGRKGVPTINVQAVCDHTFRITSVVVMWPGRTHDARIWRQSALRHRFEQDLSRCELKQVPDATYLVLRDVTVLTCNLSHNLIRRIPSKFPTKLSNITELNLQGNLIKSLPEDLHKLEGLVVLNISSNKFETIPQFIYDCTKLKTFSAQDNKITEVDPDRLRKMLSLSEVDLQDNPLPVNLETTLREIDIFTVHIGLSDPIGKELEKLE